MSAYDKLPAKPGWELRSESKPSLAKHYMPLFGGGHLMSSACWCEPFLQTELDYTVVMHNDSAAAGARRWPFSTQFSQQ